MDKLPNYVQYFGSNIVDGVAESWMEAEISWVEVDGAGWRWVHGLVIPIQKYRILSKADLETKRLTDLVLNSHSF